MHVIVQHCEGKQELNMSRKRNQTQGLHRPRGFKFKQRVSLRLAYIIYVAPTKTHSQNSIIMHMRQLHNRLKRIRSRPILKALGLVVPCQTGAVSDKQHAGVNATTPPSH